MKSFFTGEITASLILVVILAVFLTPTKLLMPNSGDLMLAVLMVLCFFVFSAFIWKERSSDERENLHRLNAGRVSFLVGTSALVLGILLQSFRHDIDPWLIYTLVAMILAKVVSRVYSQVKN